MTALRTFKFGEWTLRPAAGADDLALATEWTEADADHRGRIKPEFWIEQRLGVYSHLLHDSEGPVFFFKTVLHKMGDGKKTELHIQFMPQVNRWNRVRTRAGLISGLEWLEDLLKSARVPELFFDSRDERLIKFAQTKLGFNVEFEFEGEKRLSKRIA